MSILQAIQTRHAQLVAGTGKAISHNPELRYRVHEVSQYAREKPAEMESYADYATVYQSYAWVHKAAGLIAEALSPLSVRVVNPDDEEVENHPVAALLSYGNDTMNSADLWQRWVIHMLLGGESFFELVDDSRGRPVEVWPRRPDQVRILPDETPERIHYPRVAGYLYGERGNELRIPPEGMIHSRFYNPLNPWRGLAPIGAVREGITIDLFAQAWSKSFLRRGARPDYALVAPQGLARTEREELEEKLLVKFSGSENWHRPIVLEEGVTDIKTFSFPPKDLEWLEQRQFSRDEVAAIFGVPDELMGYGRDTYENFQTAYEVFWRLTVAKLIQHRDVSLGHFFSRVRPLLAPGERIDTDLSEVGALQEDLSPRITQATQLWALGVPFNTLDEQLGLGIGPVPGGEVGYLPFSVMPAGAERPAPASSEELSMPPLLSKARAPRGIAYGSPQHVARWKVFSQRLVPHEERMRRQLQRDFQRQQNEVLRRLREEFGKSLAARVKQPGTVLDVNDLLDWEAEIEKFREMYRAVFTAALVDFGEAQLDELGVGVLFDLQNPLVEEAIRAMVIRFAQDINQTTQERMIEVLREVLVEAESDGWGIPRIQEEIYERISTVYNVRKSPYETERIARTEMNKAANAGTTEAMRQSGVVRRKAWLAALDDRTRDTHVLAHQQYEAGIPLEELFHVGADTMLQPGGGSLPEEIINCRCTTVAVIEEEA